MSDSSEKPWSDNPNAPQISSLLYLVEKYSFAGLLLGLISYGIVIALFFRCMHVLLNPVKPIKRGIKWALIVHTVAIFLFLTIPFAIDLHNVFVEYIDNRQFPGTDKYPPGPIGYDVFLNTQAAGTVYNVMFPLNQWLADGLLLYRCYVIYSMNLWLMAFPCLIYLASVAVGIAYIYQESGIVYNVVSLDLGTSYLSLWISPKVILTLMIVTRLFLHRRKFRKAMGALDRSSGLYTAAIALLVESFALSTIAYLLYIVPRVAKLWTVGPFSNVLSLVQVIAPYLTILRVANRRSMMSDTLSGSTDSIRFGSQGTTEGGGSPPDSENSTDATGVDCEAPGGLGVGAEDTTEEVPL